MTSDAAAIREHLNHARDHARHIILACDEAEDAMRQKDQSRLVVYASAAYGTMPHLRYRLKQACKLIGGLPLDSLLRASLRRKPAGGGIPCQRETRFAEGVRADADA